MGDIEKGESRERKDVWWKSGESIVGKVKVDQGSKVCKAVRQ